MGNSRRDADQFRSRLRAERERRDWTQGQLAELMAERTGVKAYGTTIAKLEAGDRAVQLDELVALANIFGVSLDALVGRGHNGSDLVWAVSKLTSVAQKSAAEIATLNQRVAGELQDVRHYSQYDRYASVDGMIATAIVACEAMTTAHDRLMLLADAFPLPGRAS